MYILYVYLVVYNQSHPKIYKQKHGEHVGGKHARNDQ